MANRSPKRPEVLPTRQQVLEFIQSSDTPAGKREIARAFGLKGQEKIALKRLLRDMAEEGLIDGKKTSYHRMGGLQIGLASFCPLEYGNHLLRLHPVPFADSNFVNPAISCI